MKHQKYAKMLVNPKSAFSRSLAHQKNCGTSFCSLVINESTYKLEHKTTTFKVWKSYLFYCAPVFLIGLALGIDGRSWQNTVIYEQNPANCIKAMSKKMCKHDSITIGTGAAIPVRFKEQKPVQQFTPNSTLISLHKLCQSYQHLAH
ncbi:hypothetical protein E5L68_008220 [Pedobacter helvus]|uniref:Uncharacterized protein n=1 Tax=Pedobacter helvus TaxID=2563444 RepID=A0ABW9JG60_9SPHI